MKILKLTSFFLLLANVFGCSAQKPSAPPEEEIFADILVTKDGEKIAAQFMFYRRVSEILNGRENKDFGKAAVVVDFPQINGAALKEIESKNVQKMYWAEIENAEQDYTVTFRRKDGEYQSVVHLNPNDLSKPIKAEFRKIEK